jgi:hypothetical protein
MKWIVVLVCLVGFAAGCSSTPTNPYAAYPAAPAYAPGPVVPASPVYPAQTYAAPAAVQPAAYQQCCTPVPCCK